MGTKDNVVTAGIIDFIYTESTNGLTILNSAPMADDVGKVLQTNVNQGITQGYFDFSIVASSSQSKSFSYEIYMTPDATNTLATEYVKIYLTNTSNSPYSEYSGTVPTFSSLSTSTVDANSKILYSGTYNGTYLLQTFRLRMWIKDTYLLGNYSQFFKSKIFVKAIA